MMFAAAVSAGLFPVAGCGLIEDLLPSRVEVLLINNSDNTVDVTLYVSDEQDIPEDLLTSVGDKLEYSIAAGQTVNFSRECSNLQAIIVDDARLRVVGDIGPQASTGVLRDGEEFSCNDRIVFTFDHSDVIIDFDVTVNIEDRETQ